SGRHRAVVGSPPGGRMASPEVLDFRKLLDPIRGDNPAGVDLRADPSSNSEFYKIRDARKAASDADRKADQPKGDPAAAEAGAAPTPPDWRPVLDRGIKALAEKSKDLEIAAYLIEALVRVRPRRMTDEGDVLKDPGPFAGLRDGLRLARELVERFWHHLY